MERFEFWFNRAFWLWDLWNQSISSRLRQNFSEIGCYTPITHQTTSFGIVKSHFRKSLQKMACYDRVMAVLIMTTSTAIFTFHARTIVGRYMQYDVTEVGISVRNTSLLMPVVLLQFETQRSLANGTDFKRMTFRAQLDDEFIPDWASPVKVPVSLCNISFYWQLSCITWLLKFISIEAL